MRLFLEQDHKIHVQRKWASGKSEYPQFMPGISISIQYVMTGHSRKKVNTQCEF